MVTKSIHEKEHGLNFAKSRKRGVSIIKCRCGAVLEWDPASRMYVSPEMVDRTKENELRSLLGMPIRTDTERGKILRDSCQ